jgi:regulator of RNase E activity RraA
MNGPTNHKTIGAAKMTPPPSEWQLLSSALLADVLDGLGHRHSALPGEIRPLESSWKLCGRAATLSAVTVAAEPALPYAVEMECIDALRPGQVLVATTNGDLGSALWGELLSTAARARGAVGAVIDGLTRDAARIRAMGFPVFAAGLCPLDSKGRLDCIAHGRPIRIGSCIIRHGDWVFGDADGLVVVPIELADEAFRLALAKAQGENRVRDELAKGRPLREVFADYGIL